eukprot:768136-Hanusia_phi.AAC.6
MGNVSNRVTLLLQVENKLGMRPDQRIQHSGCPYYQHLAREEQREEVRKLGPCPAIGVLTTGSGVGCRATSGTVRLRRQVAGEGDEAEVVGIAG